MTPIPTLIQKLESASEGSRELDARSFAHIRRLLKLVASRRQVNLNTAFGRHYARSVQRGENV